MISKLLVVAGAGSYPRLVIEGAKRAGIGQVDVLAVKGSCVRATRKASDHVVAFAAGVWAAAILGIVFNAIDLKKYSKP